MADYNGNDCLLNAYGRYSSLAPCSLGQFTYEVHELFLLGV